MVMGGVTGGVTGDNEKELQVEGSVR